MNKTFNFFIIIQYMHFHLPLLEYGIYFFNYIDHRITYNLIRKKQ